MNSRQRVLAVLDRRPVDRLPVDIWHTDEVLAMLMTHYRATDDLDLYRKMGIDNQQVLPRGTPDDVRAETRRCLQTLGAGREGYIVCSCHNIQPGTPIENVLAMVDTALNDH